MGACSHLIFSDHYEETEKKINYENQHLLEELVELQVLKKFVTILTNRLTGKLCFSVYNEKKLRTTVLLLGDKCFKIIVVKENLMKRLIHYSTQILF